MSPDNSDLFFVLLRLKSYLISLLDDPSECDDSFELTDEYLIRKYPDEFQDIKVLLLNEGIKNDSDIAFDSNIHIKFKEIVQKLSTVKDLPEILRETGILVNDEELEDEEIQRIKDLKNFKMSYIENILVQLLRAWSIHDELEADFEDFSELSEENLLRMEESAKLDKLGRNAELSQKNIALLTEKYLELMSDYYFNYGGNVVLKTFVENVSKLDRKVKTKYNDLMIKHGLNPRLIK